MKTIHTVLSQCRMDCSQFISIDGCSCQLFKIYRDDSNFINNFKDDISCPALYVLISHQNRQAYIGETDNFYTRLCQHTTKKDFWEYALAFIANDGSLTTTEVRYLEAKSYELAKSINNFDLSENGQTPRSPHIQRLQQFKADEFFENVKFLCQFIDCNIFEYAKNTSAPSQSSANIDNKSLTLSSVSETPDSLSGRIKIQLSDYPPCTKGMLPFIVVKEYLRQNPNTSFSVLKNIFKTEYLLRWSTYDFLESDIIKARNFKNESGPKRYNDSDEFILCSGDGIKFVVCNQWDKHNIINILKLIKTFGWTYTIK